MRWRLRIRLLIAVWWLCGCLSALNAAKYSMHESSHWTQAKSHFKVVFTHDPYHYHDRHQYFAQIPQEKGNYSSCISSPSSSNLFFLPLPVFQFHYLGFNKSLFLSIFLFIFYYNHFFFFVLIFLYLFCCFIFLFSGFFMS